MKKVAIASPLRTAIGSFGGGLSTLAAPQLGAKVIAGVISRSKILTDNIDEVYMGNVLQAANGQNTARQAAVGAGIPDFVPATTINTVCGSGLHTVGLAYNAILAGNCEVAVAGGFESMSNAPHYLKNMRNGLKMGNCEVLDAVILDGLTCPFNNYHMGITAENIASEFNISRVEQDEYALLSQQRAAKARIEGKFADEIVDVKYMKKKEEIIFNQDEYIKVDTSLEKLSALRPAFKNDGTGTVTAGNASGINDGAAAMLVVDNDKCKDIGIEPYAFIKGFSLVGLRPEIMGMGPLFAVKKLLNKMDISINEIDLFELNEAFAVQSVACRKELGINIEKLNVNGGAIALGHPIGASGARVLVTLIHELRRQNKRYGVASLCIGTGMGIAMLIENAQL
jgi:acetyl-CoA C-acetyltransferase